MAGPVLCLYMTCLQTRLSDFKSHCYKTTYFFCRILFWQFHSSALWESPNQTGHHFLRSPNQRVSLVKGWKTGFNLPHSHVIQKAHIMDLFHGHSVKTKTLQRPNASLHLKHPQLCAHYLFLLDSACENKKIKTCYSSDEACDKVGLSQIYKRALLPDFVWTVNAAQ